MYRACFQKQLIYLIDGSSGINIGQVIQHENWPRPTDDMLINKHPFSTTNPILFLFLPHSHQLPRFYHSWLTYMLGTINSGQLTSKFTCLWNMGANWRKPLVLHGKCTQSIRQHQGSGLNQGHSICLASASLALALCHSHLFQHNAMESFVYLRGQSHTQTLALQHKMLLEQQPRFCMQKAEDVLEFMTFWLERWAWLVFSTTKVGWCAEVRSEAG